MSTPMATEPEHDELVPLYDGPVGSVFAGIQATTGEAFAMKVYPGKLDAEAKAELDAELNKLAELRAQAPVLVAKDVGELADGRFALRMELCAQSLPELISSFGPLTVPDSLVLGAAVANALAAAHQAGLLHGGATPGNVLFRPSGEPVLADFGLTLRRAFPRDSAQDAYLPPETARDGTFSVRSDIYGLGGILYLALSGESLRQEPVDGQEPDAAVPVLRRTDLPAGLAELVAKLLADDPEQRPEDARQLAADLVAMRASLAGQPPAGQEDADLAAVGAQAAALERLRNDPGFFDLSRITGRGSVAAVAAAAPAADPDEDGAGKLDDEFPDELDDDLDDLHDDVEDEPAPQPFIPPPPMHWPPAPPEPPRPAPAQQAPFQPPPFQPQPFQPPPAQPPPARPVPVAPPTQHPPAAPPPNQPFPARPAAQAPAMRPPQVNPQQPQPYRPAAYQPPRPPAQPLAARPRAPRPPSPVPPLARPPLARPPAAQPPLSQPVLSQLPPPTAQFARQPAPPPVAQLPPFQPFQRPGQPPLSYAPPGQPPPPRQRSLGKPILVFGPDRRSRGRVNRTVLALAGGGVLAALIVGGVVLLNRPDMLAEQPGEQAKVGAPAAPASPASNAKPRLDAPVDQGNFVQLSWRSSAKLDFAVIVASDGRPPKALLAHRNETLRVEVDPVRKYCFLVQGTDGNHVYESNSQPIRGASCAK